MSADCGARAPASNSDRWCTQRRGHVGEHRSENPRLSTVRWPGPPERAHSAPNGTVSVKLHKRRRLTLVVPREELDQTLIERVETLERENRILRRRVTELTAALRGEGESG